MGQLSLQIKSGCTVTANEKHLESIGYLLYLLVCICSTVHSHLKYFPIGLPRLSKAQDKGGEEESTIEDSIVLLVAMFYDSDANEGSHRLGI